MAATPRNTEKEALAQPKPRERDSIRFDAELESVKRTLYNAIDRLERLQRRDAELITT